MDDVLISGALAGFGIAMPVGAVTVMIVTLSAQTSLRTGLAGAMGTATADGLYALIAALTGAALAGLLQPVAQPMRWTAAVVLLALAAKGLADAVRRSLDAGSVQRVEEKRPLNVYLQFLGLTVLNPLTIVYFSTLVLALRNDDWPATGGLLFVVAAFAASASWQVLIAVGGALVGRVLTSDRGRLGTALIGNGVIIFLAVRLLFSG
ncbi:LysE family transporter [Streptomyces sp. V1I6]|uniref:LysE family transporter n=1 Tax=Streptomyces sp. V1I6 TaxID=3042273 RepID=UPI0027810E9B|nr:LysE family transporter [Streptomyces sp. V1I6]MDQ0845956.1 threonine/homoserine/homoserine lactone efflux protein [Streptomyces sp. V1I6]